jgi:hypothetical protein
MPIRWPLALRPNRPRPENWIHAEDAEDAEFLRIEPRERSTAAAQFQSFAYFLRALRVTF